VFIGTRKVPLTRPDHLQYITLPIIHHPPSRRHNPQQPRQVQQHYPPPYPLPHKTPCPTLRPNSSSSSSHQIWAHYCSRPWRHCRWAQTPGRSRRVSCRLSLYVQSLGRSARRQQCASVKTERPEHRGQSGEMDSALYDDMLTGSVTGMRLLDTTSCNAHHIQFDAMIRVCSRHPDDHFGSSDLQRRPGFLQSRFSQPESRLSGQTLAHTTIHMPVHTTIHMPVHKLFTPS
jgi:hypothetical protein